jgi:exopolysaccharide/PEP-CTERM locus tyrosine autokinase
MSLVELALQKIRDSRDGAASSGAAVGKTELRPREARERPTPQHLGGVAPRAGYSNSIAVDFAALRSAQVVPPDQHERRIARQFRRIKLPLLARARDSGASGATPDSLIMIASAFSGEGKTFTTVNLAMAMARERDWEVLLVDADVAKPHVSQVFGLGDKPGLLDAIANESADVENYVFRTDVTGLSILPSGRFSEDTATEMLGSSRMRDMSRRLATAADRRIVLFDSPPLLLTTEAQVLSTLVDQVVLVVRAGVTGRDAVVDAVSLLDPSKPIGVVLNQSHVEPPVGYGDAGYGAYGNYGTYGTYGEPAADDGGPQ